MKKLIVLKGFLATGKTTYKNKLESLLKIPAFDKDTIKENLSDVIGFKNRGENKKLSVASMTVMYLIFDRFGMLGNDLILESNFHKDECIHIKALSKKYGYDVLVLDFKAEYNILYERFNHRALVEKRHKTHLSIDFDNIDGFIKYLEKDLFESMFENVIDIDASNFDYQSDLALVEKIIRFINA